MRNNLVNKYKSLPEQVKASLWFLICSFITRGIAFITTPIFTRLMTTEEFGAYNVYNSWYAIIIVIVTMKLSDGVYTQGLIKFDNNKAKFTSALQGLTLTLCITWFIIYFLFKDFWNQLFHQTTSQMCAMFLTMWSVTVFNFWSAEQRVELKYKRLVVITLLVAFIIPLITIFFMNRSNDKVHVRIWTAAVVQLIFYTPLFIVHIIRGKKIFSKEIWKYGFVFNLPLIPHYLSQTVLNSSDRIMIERMVDNSSAGIYSLAYSISLIMLIFNTSLLNTLNPWIFQQIKTQNYKKITSIAYPALIFIAFVNVMLIAFAPEAIRFFAPKEYYDAIWIIPPVAMSVYYQFMYSLYADFEFYYEKTKYITIATLTGAIVNIILNFICIRLFGYIAAGYTTLVCYIIYALMHFLFMRKICKDEGVEVLPYSYSVIIKISIVFMLIGFIYLLTYHNSLLRYSLTFILAFITFINRNKIRWVVSELKGIKRSK